MTVVESNGVSQNAAEALAEFTAGLRPAEVPPVVRDKMKLHLLDTFGAMLASYPTHTGAIFHKMANEMGGGREEATVVGFGTRLPAALTALVNGSLGHGQDYDDTHSGSVTHPGAPIMATAVAMAERQGAGGLDLLTAAAAGYEVTIRIGAAAPTQFHSRGYHTTGVCAAFGAAAAAGKLLGLDAEQICNALGLVGSQAAGIGEFNFDGTWVKQLHPGWAAHSGIVAALLAQQGLTGPADVLDSGYSLYRTHLGDRPFDVGLVHRGLGSEWKLLETSVKLYPSCHHNHGPLDAVLELRRRHGIRPDDIHEMVGYVPEAAVPIICEPVDLKLNPPTPYAAKFSLHYCLAVAMIEGHGLASTFAEDRLRDSRIVELARRVRYEVDPESLFPAAYGGAVDLVLRDGRTLHLRVPACKGSSQNPASLEEVEAKFLANLQGVLSEETSGRLAGEVLRLESLADLRGLTRLLVAG